MTSTRCSRRRLRESDTDIASGIRWDFGEAGTTRKPDGKLSYETCEIDPPLLKEMYRVLKSEKEGTGLNSQRITGLTED